MRGDLDLASLLLVLGHKIVLFSVHLLPLVGRDGLGLFDLINRWWFLRIVAIVE